MFGYAFGIFGLVLKVSWKFLWLLNNKYRTHHVIRFMSKIWLSESETYWRWTRYNFEVFVLHRYMLICVYNSGCLMTKQQLPNVFLNQKGLTVTVFLPSIQIRVLTSEKNVVSRSKRSLSWISYKFLYTIFKVL